MSMSQLANDETKGNILTSYTFMLTTVVSTN